MTNKDLVFDYLRNAEGPRCDDCVSSGTGVQPRQQVNQIARQMQSEAFLARSSGQCSGCGRSKMINRLLPVVESRPSSPPRPDPTSPLFRAPERRGKTLALAAVAVLGLVAFMVYLMARGPDSQTVADQRVATVTSKLGTPSVLTPAVFRSAAEGFQEALALHPGHVGATAAISDLKGQLDAAINAAIADAALELAGDLIAAAFAVWPDDTDYHELGPLPRQLASMVEEAATKEEITRLLTLAEIRLEGGEEDGARIGVALENLRRALELNPQDDRVQSAFTTARNNVSRAAESALAGGNNPRARQLIDAAGAQWAGDAEFEALRSKVAAITERAESLRQVESLLASAEADLAVDRLRNPPGDNAAGKYTEVLVLDPDNKRALSGMDRVIERYVELARAALDRGAGLQAVDLIDNLAALEPNSTRVDSLRREVEALQAKKDAAPTPRPAEPQAPPRLAMDAEDELWQAIKDTCNEIDLRRYIEAYPSGRYIEEAWLQTSRCLSRRPENQ